MSKPRLFETVDQAALHFTAMHVGTAMMQGTALVLHRLASDDAIPPDAFQAGLTMAHLEGAASAMAGMELQDGWEEVLAADIGAFVVDQIKLARGLQAGADLRSTLEIGRCPASTDGRHSWAATETNPRVLRCRGCQADAQ